jgi:hypothetical protein
MKSFVVQKRIRHTSNVSRSLLFDNAELNSTVLGKVWDFCMETNNTMYTMWNLIGKNFSFKNKV